MSQIRQHRWFAWMAVFALLLATRCPVWAGPALDTPISDFSGFSDWTGTTGYGTISDGGGYLSISFAAQSGPPAYEEDTIRSGTGLRNYSTGTAILFNFAAEDTIPLDALIYLHSTSGRTWEYSFESQIPSVGDFYIVPLYFPSGWSGGDELMASFDSDLASIDWVGITIARAMSVSAQDYGLDVFVVSTDPQYDQENGGSGVPEPGMIVMMATALLSFAALFRWRMHAAQVSAGSSDSPDVLL